MSNDKYTDERLNLFIDEQLDFDETDEIHQAVLKDKELGARVCQLKAIRELVRYAYESTPVSNTSVNLDRRTSNRFFRRSVAASFLLVTGAISGWMVNENIHADIRVASASDVFQYFKDKSPVDRSERKIIIHVTTGDIATINAALNEAEQLLASYQESKTPMRLDVITNRDGINMLRVGVSPYADRVERIINSNSNVSFYACQQSIDKAMKKEGRDIVMVPHTFTTKTARDLISDRLEEGWVYIKV